MTAKASSLVVTTMLSSLCADPMWAAQGLGGRVYSRTQANAVRLPPELIIGSDRILGLDNVNTMTMPLS